MATKKTIELEVNTNAEQAKKGIDDLGQSVDNLNQAEKKVQKTNKDLHASFEEVYGEVKPLTAQMGEMEDRLYQMALAGDTASKEFNDLLTEVGRYRKVQMDTDMVVDAAATTMSQKLGGAIQGAASGFALVQGSMALFGTESEALEETLLKVQSAMAITQGLEGLREGAKSFKAMGMAAKGAFKSIKVGMAATGIGLLLVAVGAIAAYWDDIVGALDGSQDKVDALNKEYEQGEVILKNQKAQMDIQLQIMEAEGATEEEIHKIKLAQLDTEIEHGKLRVKIAQQQKEADVEQAKRQNKILKLAINVITAPINAIIKGYNAVAEALGFGGISTIGAAVADYFIDVDNIAKEGQASIDQANQDLKLLEGQRELLQVKFNKQQKDNAKASRQTANERKNDLLAIERELFDKRFALREESEQKEIALAKETNRRELQDLKKRRKNGELNFLQFQQFRIVTQNKLNKDLKDINDKYRAEELEAERERLQNLKDIENEFLNELEAETDIANKRLMSEQAFEIQLVEDKYFRLIELAKQYGEDTSTLEANRTAALKDINDKYRKSEEDANKNLTLAKAQIAIDGLRLVSDIADLFAAKDEKAAKRAFNIKKAADIAEATMSGYKAVVSTYANAPGGVVLKSIQAAIAGAFSAVQIAKIASAKFEGGQVASDLGDTSAGAGGGAMPQPSFNVVGDSGINQLAELQMQPTQAFVVSGDITTAQSLDRNKIQNATI